MKTNVYFYPAVDNSNIKQFVSFLTKYQYSDTKILALKSVMNKAWTLPIFLCLQGDNAGYIPKIGNIYSTYPNGEDFFIKHEYQKIIWNHSITFNLF